MKILRLGDKGKEIPATLDQDGQYRDLSSHIDDISPAAMALEQLAKLKSIDITSLPLLDSAMRIGCPINDVPNFFCVGLNYARHADETGMARPSEPILFSKLLLPFLRRMTISASLKNLKKQIGKSNLV